MSLPLVCGPLAIRQSNIKLQNGEVVDGHGHNFGHVTFFYGGKWLVKKRALVLDGNGEPIVDPKTGKPFLVFVEDTIVDGREINNFLLIEAKLWHEITLVSDGPAFYQCVYPHLKENGEVVSEFTGWEPAYE